MAYPIIYKPTYRFRREIRKGPYGQELNTFVWMKQSLGYTQARPYNLDTNLEVNVQNTTYGSGDAREYAADPANNPAYQMAVNKARASFVDKLGESSQFGATLTAEARKTWSTVSKGITDALLAAKAVSKGRLGDAARHLGFYPPTVTITRSVRKPGSRRRKDGTYKKRLFKQRSWKMPDGRLVAQTNGNRWLWYSYGVKPLCEDIHNGMDVLTRPIPEKSFSGSGFNSQNQNYKDDTYHVTRGWQASVRMTAEVRVVNPNLWLANQLGLINPVQWFVEGVKLSFVLDWFSNLSQIVNQMTDFAGLELIRARTTSKLTYVTTTIYLFEGQAKGYKVGGKGVCFKRQNGIADAKLLWAYERFEWQRGLNAISLLTKLLGRELKFGVVH
jgi:hypothetical protein